jgi:hypothetical protein
MLKCRKLNAEIQQADKIQGRNGKLFRPLFYLLMGMARAIAARDCAGGF